MKTFFRYLIIVAIFLSLLSKNSNAQQRDSIVIKHIFNEVFTHGKSYENLKYLCKEIGPRISGSNAAEKAIQWAFQKLKESQADSVWLQEVMVPHWVRGQKEEAFLFSKNKKIKLAICALGNSVGTPENGIKSMVIEVKTFEELRAIPTENVKGKIVYFSRPFPDTVLFGGLAYGLTVNQRSQGPIEAAKKGAIGVIVRSMTHAHDQYPHTGATQYKDSFPAIPACAISTADAAILSSTLQEDPNAQVEFKQHCKMLNEVKSYNVVAELKGTEKPEEIIVLGAHIDSWDIGEGAHDDGAGVVQCIEALQTLKKIQLSTKRSIRVVLFINEENGLRGGLKYAELANVNKEKHIAAIETDAGGFMPRHIGFAIAKEQLFKYKTWENLLAPYGVQAIDENGGGADIGPLKKQGALIIGFHPDGQKYFDYHHTENDVFEHVNKRELQFGSVVLAGLIYLISEHGIE